MEEEESEVAVVPAVIQVAPRNWPGAYNQTCMRRLLVLIAQTSKSPKVARLGKGK
jgi:hypothetical protein